jgi:hypothetical protein
VSNRPEKGIALVTALLVLLLVSSIIVGLTWLVMTDQKLGGNTADREKAFYGAEAGMESLTAALANAFNINYALSAQDVANIENNPPAAFTNQTNIQFLQFNGTSGYQLQPAAVDLNGNPAAQNHTILTGPYAGLVGLLTPYTLTVTARTPLGSEVKLQRTVQTVAIPVFQFGIFSATDLSFFAGPNFNFGGRVHTNGNLWLAENGGTLTLSDKVTAAGEIIRTNLENGFPTTASYNTTVNITTNPGSGNFAALATNQGSTLNNSSYGNIGAPNEPTFANLAAGTYNGNIAVKETGVSSLNLGIATPALGGQPIDLIRLPVANEFNTNPGKFAERYYNQASIRILLADYGASGTCVDSDITKLNLISPGVPVDLATLSWDAASTVAAYKNPNPGLTGVGVNVWPLPVSNAQGAAYSAADGYWQQKFFPVITGCIKIDYQTQVGGAFVDVTLPVLNLGYTGRNIHPLGGAFVVPPTMPALPAAQVAAQGPTINGGVATVGCTDPSPNAVIRLARLRDNPSTGVGGVCGVATLHGTDYWPNVLWDPREGTLRDNALTVGVIPKLTLAGAMNYVELDINNLAAYIVANAAVINNITGYTVYFSDRRGNLPDPNLPPSTLNAISGKTGGFGYEDFVNSPQNPATGCPNGALDPGEDVEADFNAGGIDTNPILRTYGNTLAPALPAKLWPIGNNGTQLGTVATLIPAILGINASCPAPPNTPATNAWPFAVANNTQDLRENSPIFFRRALKIVDGASIALGVCDGVPCGLTVVSENPAYIQGDYNDANLSANFNGAHVAASVIADAVTLLSDRWNDVNSFWSPYNTANRQAVTTDYRTAIAAGKGIPFLQPAGMAADYGTDGGMHNFLRYIENWGGQTLNYRGSIVSFYYNHQAVGDYKCCNTVYSPPSRGYNFDTEFLTPSLLPPKTPLLRSINTVGFTQEVLPTQ